MKQTIWEAARGRTKQLMIIIVAAVLLFGFSLASVINPGETEAVTITPNNTGIAQGALPDRSSTYQNNALDSTVASGAKWIRLDLWWFQVEATQGTYNWTKFDNLYGNAKSKGLNVLLVVGGSPTWASGCASVWCPPDPAHDTHWRNFLTAAANRYKDPSAYNINTYEIWNEPNIQRFFEVPNASVYTNRVLKPAFQSITAAHPGATVLTGGTAPAEFDHAINIAPWEFVRDIYAAGGKSYFHHVAHHPYTWPYAPGEGNAGWNSWQQMDEDESGTTSIRTSMANNSDSSKQIWITEVGYPSGTCAGCVSETIQKNMLAQVYNEWSKKTYGGKIFWFAMLNDGTNSSDPEQNFGLKRADNTAKPALDSFNKIASQQYYNTVKTTTGLKHYWPLDELSGATAIDTVSTGAVNGSYIGTVARGTDNVVVGTPAATFPETITNRVEVASSDSTIRLAGTAWTVEFNARRVGGTLSWPGLMGRGDATTANGWEIYNHHAGGDFVSFKRNNQECATSTLALADGKSHHFAVTYQGSTVSWFVDGAAAGTCTISFPTPSTASQTFWIGASPRSPGNNALGHLSFYDTALSGSQAAAHAAAAVRLP